MSYQEYESLVFRIEELSQNQQIMAKYMAEMKCQLDALSEQFNNRSELQQRTSSQDALTQLHRQFNQRSALPAAPIEVVNVPPESVSYFDSGQPQPMEGVTIRRRRRSSAAGLGGTSYQDQSQQQPTQVQSSVYQLVFDRSGSRAVLMSALSKAQKRLIIVCPWLSRNSIDADLIQKLRDCLNRNCRIDIGWGYLSGRGKTGIGWGNSAIKDLKQLERDYPQQFRLKLLGTHEKFLICDASFTMLGSHNMLTSNTQGVTREVGIRTTDSNIIQGLIDRFDGAEVQDAQAIDENLAAGSVNLDDVEALDAQYIGSESDTSLVNPDLDEPDEDEDTDDSAEDSQSPDAEEFLCRHKKQERDFTGINLAGFDFTGKSLSLGGLNFSEANLTRAKLSKEWLASLNFSRANLSR